MHDDRFRLSVQRGAGPDGVRYRAVDGFDGAAVDLIVLASARADPSRWPALARRLRTASLLDHPSARKVVAFDPADDPPSVVLEAMPGPSLADKARGADPPGRAEAADWAGALAEGHRVGLAHGRFGPQAIFAAGVGWKVDWTGLDVDPPIDGARRDDLVRSCLAPERLDGGEPSPSADVYALGATLFWAATGHPLPHGVSDAQIDFGDPIFDAAWRSMVAADPVDRVTAREAAAQLAPAPSSMAVTMAHASSGLPAGSKGWRTDRLGFAVDEPSFEGSALRPGRDRLGRFLLGQKLGQGGMGAVYRAVDLADGVTVAIKVLTPGHATQPEALRRFLKEGRLLAEVNNPYVTNLLEANEDDGIPFIALEFVDGISLGDLLERRQSIDEASALRIAADVARGLAAAHERGIVHRDVKPQNILLVGQVDSFDPGDSSAGPPKVKLSDFGLARHVVESESLNMTRAGMVVGTPWYMAPEQSAGLGTIGPPADVYALGATLFHLLAGRPPFLSSEPLGVIAMHRDEPPPDLTRLDARVGEGLARVVAKALAKAPEDRYADASAMLVDLERLIRGEPTGVAVHPLIPPCDPRKISKFEFRFELRSSPRQLWPEVSNTERFNRAVGMPAAEYNPEPDPEGRGVRQFARYKVAGLELSWQEHPYEWVEGRRLGILREYRTGPIRWMVSQVELEPGPGGGTILTHRVRILARGWIGRMIAAVQVGWKGGRAMRRVYQRIDAAISGRLGDPAEVDPFEPSVRPPASALVRLDRVMDGLGPKGIDPAVVGRLGEFFANAPAQEVGRIRPLALARRLGLDGEQVVAACLLAARDGLLDLRWDILCPACRIPGRVVDTLADLADHGRCDACDLDFAIDFAGSVELIFRVDPELRPVELRTYCIGGPAHSSHVAAQVRVGPGERCELDLQLADGQYRLRGPQLPRSYEFRVEPSAVSRRWDLSLDGTGPEPPESLRSGRQVIALANVAGREVVVRVERTAPRADAYTAARASASALFRDLFPDEVLSPGQLAHLAHVTLLVTEPAAAAEPDQAHDDARGFALAHRQFRRVEACLRREGGALVKTVDAGTVSAFDDPVAALRAALALAEVDPDEPSSSPGPMRIGLHRGPAIVATLNDHLDYFGTTVRVARALPALARPGEVVLTPEVASDPRVAALLRDRSLEAAVSRVDLPGLVGGFIQRVRVAPTS